MKRKNPESVFFLLLSLFWFLYLAFRAWKVPPVYDEVTTFFLYVLPGEFFPFASYPSANNHWMYSMGTWFFYQVLPESLFSLRVFSLLSFPLYALGVFKLGKKLNYKRSRWTLWFLLMGLHFPMEFFAYSRGYAWGLTALLWGIYFAHNYQDTPNRQNLMGLLGSLALGVGFNLNTLPLLGLALVWVFWVKPKDSLKHSIWVAGFGVLPLLFYTRYSWFLKEKGELYYGVEGFWTHSTLPTLSEALFSSASVGTYWLFSVWILIALLTLMLAIRNLKWRAIPFELFGFLGTWIGLTILYFVWGIHLPQDRTALFIFFLLMVSLAFSIQRLKPGFLSTLLSIAAGLIVMTSFFQFSTQASSFTLWKQEQVPAKFLKTITEDPMAFPSVSSHYLTAHSYALQRHLYHPDSPPIMGLRDTAYSTDFVIREMGRTSRFFRRNYGLVADDNATNKTLWTLKSSQWEKKVSGVFSEPEIDKEFLPVHTLVPDTSSVGWHKVIVSYSWKTPSRQPIYFAIQKHGSNGESTFESLPIFPKKGKLQISHLAYPFFIDSTDKKLDFFFHNPGRISLKKVEYSWELLSPDQ